MKLEKHLLIYKLNYYGFYKTARIIPVGGQTEQHFHGRIIGATNKTLLDLRDPKQFRSDFFYRLSSNIISLPTLFDQLEQTPNDLTLFVDHITEIILKNHATDFSGEILNYIDEHLRHYQWPGNVRELEQCIRRLIITKEYLPPTLSTKHNTDEITAQDLIQDYAKTLYNKHQSYAKFSNTSAR